MLSITVKSIIQSYTPTFCSKHFSRSKIAKCDLVLGLPLFPPSAASRHAYLLSPATSAATPATTPVSVRLDAADTVSRMISAETRKSASATKAPREMANLLRLSTSKSDMFLLWRASLLGVTRSTIFLNSEASAAASLILMADYAVTTTAAKLVNQAASVSLETKETFAPATRCTCY